MKRERERNLRIAKASSCLVQGTLAENDDGKLAQWVRAHPGDRVPSGDVLVGHTGRHEQCGRTAAWLQRPSDLAAGPAPEWVALARSAGSGHLSSACRRLRPGSSSRSWRPRAEASGPGSLPWLARHDQPKQPAVELFYQAGYLLLRTKAALLAGAS